MAAMVLVENPGDWYYAYPQLRHARWGMPLTLTDWIFPFFVFIMGLAIPLSMLRRRRAGISAKALVFGIARRSLILFGLGLLLYLYPGFNFASMRIPGVLQCLAVVYLASALLCVGTSWRVQALMVPLIALGNWFLLNRVPVPGFGEPNLQPGSNLAAWIDSTLLGGHLRNPGSDPEGLLTMLSAVATCLLGVLAGHWLLAKKSPAVKAGGLAAAGAALIAAGQVWSLSYPMIKDLWTGSYALFTGGLALLVFALCFALVDALGFKSWTPPFAAYGANPIAVYLASQVTYVTLLAVLHVPASGGRISLQEVLYRFLFRSWLNPSDASLAFSLTTVLIWGIPLWALYKKRIYLRI